MKSLYLTCLLLMLTYVAYGQVDLGIGLVSIGFDDKTVLSFYNSPSDKKPVKTIEFFDDKSISSWNIRNIEKQQEWLKPETLWLDYSSFVLRCKNQQNGWYEVIVNHQNGQSLWLKKSTVATFVTWENYLRGMFSVARNPEQMQKIRKLPNERSVVLEYTDVDCFQVKKMHGDWIEVFTPDHCKDDETVGSNTVIKSGWIKWRKGNQLLIEYFITS
jgi:hypothetical protein